MSNKIQLSDFLKKYTAIPNKFIDTYYSFYYACNNDIFGITDASIAQYLGLTSIVKLRERARKKYKNGIDYIIKHTHEGRATNAHYFFSFDCFEKICVVSNTSTGDIVRDYFITLRKFVNYYREHFANNINSLATSGKYVYIMLVNKNKSIFKLGSTGNIRKRLYTYAIGKDTHPDIYFIMLIKDPKAIERCVKALVPTTLYSKRKELYKIKFDALKKVTFNCAISHDELLQDIDYEEMYDSYVMYDNAVNVDILDMKNNVVGYKNIHHVNDNHDKKGSKKVSKVMNKKGSKVVNKKGSKVVNKKGSKVVNKKGSKVVNKKGSKIVNRKGSKVVNKKRSNIITKK